MNFWLTVTYLQVLVQVCFYPRSAISAVAEHLFPTFPPMTLKINQNTSLENVTLYQHSECHSLQKLLSGHKDRRKQTKEKKTDIICIYKHIRKLTMNRMTNQTITFILSVSTKDVNNNHERIYLFSLLSITLFQYSTLLSTIEIRNENCSFNRMTEKL